MKIRQYQIDAFATRAFEGNPAAVCPLEEWLDDALLQAVAEENNLSETAFFVPCARGFQLRWFTPVAEVDLCGHATLAAAFVLFDVLGHARESVVFETKSGDLVVEKKSSLIAMDFPAQPPRACDVPAALVAGLGRQPSAVLAADDYIAVFETEEDIRNIVPDQSELQKLALRGVAVTAPGTDADFVSRFFAPKFGIPEDPVTGSAHCELAPYWQARLGKSLLLARQLSKRGGQVRCEVMGERVMLSGSAVKFMEAEIVVPG